MPTVRCSGLQGGCIPACTGQVGVCIPACTGQGVCIPACTGQGAVYPSMHWAGVCLPRVCLPMGVSAQGYVSAQGGVCPGGVYPSMHWAGGSAQGGVCWGCLPGGVCLPRGCQTPPPPVNRMTDRCLWKYYLATTSLRTVNMINLFLQLMITSLYIGVRLSRFTMCRLSVF